LNLDQHKLAEALREQAHSMVEDASAFEQGVEEFDFKEAIARILGKEDWTDKLAAWIGRLRGLFHRHQQDTELPEDLKALIPDMKKVAVLYGEMIEGYKDFIREVWEAQIQK
jgi:hypothetical protein